MTDPKKAHEGTDKAKGGAKDVDKGGTAKPAGDDIKKQGDKLKDVAK